MISTSLRCTHFLLGPVVKSYPVNDRVQEAEIDPSMLIDDYDEPEFDPCPVCQSDDNEEVLVLCDGCDRGYHTYCVDLDTVPAGAWFCDDCATTRAIESVTGPGAAGFQPSLTRTPNIRTRNQLRQHRQRNQVASSDWARVWQTVNRSVNIDLDFPFYSSAITSALPPTRRAGRQGPSRRLWERRLQVARQQGGGDQLEEAAAAVLDNPASSRPRPESVEPESVDELLSWNAFEKARDIEADPRPKTRKRRSPTASPSDRDLTPRRKRRKSATTSPKEPMPAPQPERRLKRPRTRRAVDLVENGNDTATSEASSSRRLSAVHNAHPTHTSNGSVSETTNGAVPSFLQSLLDEVESTAPGPDDSPHAPVRPTLTIANPAALDHPSPHHSSPAVSPTTSNHPSPRALSATPPPQPHGSSGPGSPAPLTSKIEPVYPPAPDMPPVRAPSPQSDSGPHSRVPRGSKSRSRVPRWALDSSGARSSSPPAPPAPRPHSEGPSLNRAEQAPEMPNHAATSPTTASVSSTTPGLSLAAKTAVQGLVKEALQTPWHGGEVNKEQYVAINKTVSRMLYDRVADAAKEGNTTAVVGEEVRRLAGEEVTKAVRAIREDGEGQ